MERLLHHPQRLFSLSSFSQLLGVSKSTISDDLSLIREVLRERQGGTIETVQGATGGVRYRPSLMQGQLFSFLEGLSKTLSTGDRILPGGFLYMGDIIFNPRLCQTLGRIFAQLFSHVVPDFIVTMETKGIPLALMTAHFFNVPLVTIGRSKQITEGSVVSINVVSGSSQKIQTMSLARRALPEGARVLLMDDFMKAGGTAKGMMHLLKEFNAQVLGLGLLIATATPVKKLVEEYLPLLILEDVQVDSGVVKVVPNPLLKERTTEMEGEDLEEV